jgi:hypothetical protein
LITVNRLDFHDDVSSAKPPVADLPPAASDWTSPAALQGEDLVDIMMKR